MGAKSAEKHRAITSATKENEIEKECAGNVKERLRIENA